MSIIFVIFVILSGLVVIFFSRVVCNTSGFVQLAALAQMVVLSATGLAGPGFNVLFLISRLYITVLD